MRLTLECSDRCWRTHLKLTINAPSNKKKKEEEEKEHQLNATSLYFLRLISVYCPSFGFSNDVLANQSNMIYGGLFQLQLD